MPDKKLKYVLVNTDDPKFDADKCPECGLFSIDVISDVSKGGEITLTIRCPNGHEFLRKIDTRKSE
jgi:hypothetical protein